MEEAIVLSRFAQEAIIVHRRDTFRASQIMQDKAKANPKIKFIPLFISFSFLFLITSSRSKLSLLLIAIRSWIILRVVGVSFPNAISINIQSLLQRITVKMTGPTVISHNNFGDFICQTSFFGRFFIYFNDPYKWPNPAAYPE